MGNRIFFGKSVEEAIERGLKEMGISREEAVVHVLEEPTKGLFGFLGSKPAKIEMGEKIDPFGKAKEFLLSVLAKMGVKADVETVKQKEGVLFNVVGERLGMIIGHHGQTLDALQNLVNAVAGRYGRGRERIILDAENYREKRKESLEELADRVVRQVLKTKESVKLEPMSANDRRIIHTHLQSKAHIKTQSEGEEPHRSIIVRYRE